MRTLYYVPILHAKAEMGTAADVMNAIGMFTSQYDEMMRILSFIEVDIATYCQALSSTVISTLHNEGVLSSAGVTGTFRIFNDSFVSGEGTLKNFRKQFPDSPHLALLETLIGYGGCIQDTESSEKLAECIRSASRHASDPKTWTTLSLFTEERDRHIAENIDKTLQNHERAILFMGAAHDVPRFLPTSIKVRVMHRADVLTSRLQIMSQTFRNSVLSSYLNKPDSYGHTLPTGLL